MRVLLGVFLPALLQALVVLIIVSMNQGNGSWAGLAAFLIGIIVIPITFVINGLYVWKNPESSILTLVAKGFSLAMIVPLLCMITLVL